MDPKMAEDLFNPLIRKRKVLIAGKGDVPSYQNGTKVTFHFKTEACYSDEDDGDGEVKVIDDSKSSNKPMELFIGKQFKFPLWEEWIKHMRLGEVSQLSLDWSLCRDIYPLLSKSYRNFVNPCEHKQPTHCCMGQAHVGTGHADLDELVQQRPPRRLRFTIELIRVEDLPETDKEIWLMNEQEMKENIPALQARGNHLFQEKRFEEAALQYRKALAILDQLMSREKPGDADWINYDLMKVPLLCNLAQCELYLEQYYQAIRHTDEVLEKDPRNVKALYRRAKAHQAVWNVEEARRDFQRVAELDTGLRGMVQQHLVELEQQIRRQNQQDIGLLRGKLF